MKKKFVVLKICIIFAAFLLAACTAMKFAASYCTPTGHCVGVGLEIKSDSCK